MSEDSIYQTLRSHLAYLRLTATAEALPGELDHAQANKLGHTALSGTAPRRRGGVHRDPSSGQPGTFRLVAVSVATGGLRLRRPAVGGQKDGERARHVAVLRGRHQRLVHRPTGCGQDHVGRRVGPGVDRRRLPHLLHDRGGSRGPMSPGCARRTVGHHHAVLRRAALLVIDEVGYLPLANEAAASLFQVITTRYLKSSTVLTTNLGIASWGKIFDDPMVAGAMLDRLLHRSVVFNIDGDSYRMRTHRARSENLRKGVRPTAAKWSTAATHPGDQLGNFSDREWGVSEIGGTAIVPRQHLTLGLRPCLHGPPRHHRTPRAERHRAKGDSAVIREELSRLFTLEERHRRLLARLMLALGLSIVVFVGGTVLTSAYESGHKGGDINGFGDAAFFSVVQMLTVSSQIKNPLTWPGRVVDIGLGVWPSSSSPSSLAASLHSLAQVTVSCAVAWPEWPQMRL